MPSIGCFIKSLKGEWQRWSHWVTFGFKHPNHYDDNTGMSETTFDTKPQLFFFAKKTSLKSCFNINIHVYQIATVNSPFCF